MQNTDTAALPAEGSHYFMLGGDHAGQEVRVIRSSHNTVVFALVRNNTGANMGKAKTNSYKELRMKTNVWQTQTARPEDVLTGKARIATAYRHVNTPKPAPVEKAPDFTPVTGLIVAPQANANMSFEEVTPMQAQAWLDGMGRNRKVTRMKVIQYGAALKRNEWRPNAADPFKIDWNGQLGNGQHRCLAIIESGIPMWGWVIRGVDPAEFDVMDSGRPRTTGDIFDIHGYTGGTTLSAVVRNLMYYDTYRSFNPPTITGRADITSATSLQYVADHPEVPDGARLGDRVIHGSKLRGGVGTWGACFTLFMRLSPEDAHTFAEYVITGANMGKDHPALTLRNRVTAATRSGAEFSASRTGVEELAAVIIKAWNAYRKKRTVKVLRYNGNEPFPVAI